MQVVSLLALFGTALAKPLALIPRDSIAPPITNPKAGAVWKAGETQTVTWDLSGLEGVTPSNPNGMILLGTFIDGKEHLFVSSPIKEDFPILSGNVTITVPSVATGSDYIVCLFGNSGNISPTFTILGSDSPSSSAVPSPTKIQAASSSNTLPPHQTADPSTSVTLPPGATVTDPIPSLSATSTPESGSSTSVSASVPTGALPSGVSVTSGGVASTSSATSPATSPSTTGTATGDAGNFGSKVSVTRVHLWTIVGAFMALRVLL
ncbi:hypothetical protein C8Q74DRAFT_1203181 [Fomes fomentarius]|nr:hypothetical protein C8Q74DRAFT_1203181 [Fomes fomentarius]